MLFSCIWAVNCLLVVSDKCLMILSQKSFAINMKTFIFLISCKHQRLFQFGCFSPEGNHCVYNYYTCATQTNDSNSAARTIKALFQANGTRNSIIQFLVSFILNSVIICIHNFFVQPVKLDYMCASIGVYFTLNVHLREKGATTFYF